MSIEKRLLDVAHNAFMEKSYAHEMTAAEERDAIAYTIKAYEAAKWRPIEEAPRDGSTMQFWSEKLKRPFPLFANWEDADWGGPGFRIGVTIFEIGSTHLQGAMFKTIEPPPQK